MAIFFIPLFDVTFVLVFLILLSSLTTFVHFVSAKQKVHTLSATENAFQTYFNSYSKKYEDEVEVIERFKIFKSNDLNVKRFEPLNILNLFLSRFLVNWYSRTRFTVHNTLSDGTQ